MPRIDTAPSSLSTFANTAVDFTVKPSDPDISSNDDQVNFIPIPARFGIVVPTSIVNDKTTGIATAQMQYRPFVGIPIPSTDQFDLTAADKSTSQSNKVHITVQIMQGTNGIPIAKSQDLQTTKDTALSITLTASDPDNDPITFQTPSTPTGGTLELASDYATSGKLTYTPKTGFSGPDSFTFTVKDNHQGLSASAKVTITVS